MTNNQPSIEELEQAYTAAELGVSYEIAKAMLEREERYAAGDETEAADARDSEDML